MKKPAPVILIIGNIAAGKTTLAQSLVSELQWPSFSIDSARREVARDFSQWKTAPLAAEYLAWHRVFHNLEFHSNWIFEFSGTGIHRHGVRMVIDRKKPYLVVELHAPKHLLLERVKQRQFENLPFIQRETTEGYVERVERELASLQGESFWQGGYYLSLDSSRVSRHEMLKEIGMVQNRVTDFNPK